MRGDNLHVLIDVRRVIARVCVGNMKVSLYPEFLESLETSHITKHLENEKTFLCHGNSVL